jgi:hypothetical protein
MTGTGTTRPVMVITKRLGVQYFGSSVFHNQTQLEEGTIRW